MPSLLAIVAIVPHGAGENYKPANKRPARLTLAEAHGADEWAAIDELLAAQAGFSAIARATMSRA